MTCNLIRIVIKQNNGKREGSETSTHNNRAKEGLVHVPAALRIVCYVMFHVLLFPFLFLSNFFFPLLAFFSFYYFSFCLFIKLLKIYVKIGSKYGTVHEHHDCCSSSILLTTTTKYRTMFVLPYTQKHRNETNKQKSKRKKSALTSLISLKLLTSCSYIRLRTCFFISSGSFFIKTIARAVKEREGIEHK